MQNTEDRSVYHDAFQFISLVLGGACALFETEGQRICEKLDETEEGRLKCAMMSMGKAMLLAKERAASVLLHDTQY